jgi:putative redox protein
MKVTLHRTVGSTMIARGDSNHWVVLDTKQRFGGHEAAPQPMEMVLISLGGCTAMDVESLLNKMRTPAQEFTIEINAERVEEHPRIFKNINMTLIFRGENLNQQNIEKAVSLSRDKYCSVTAMLKKSVKIDYTIKINPATDEKITLNRL